MNFPNSSNFYQQQLLQQQINKPQQELTIKGKYVNSIDEVISLQSSDIEPAICVDLSNSKVYIKTFNIDGSFKVEEFVKNENAKIDTRSQAEKLNDVVLQLMSEINSIKSELGIGVNENGK